MLKPYPGDDNQKRIVRALLYVHVCNLWANSDIPEGKFITLVGDGAEINLFRFFLKVPAKDAVFIDKDKTVRGVDRASREWKKSVAIKGNILQYLTKLKDQIAFVNLDFMGHFKLGETDKIFMEVGKKLAPYGIVAFTFVRAQESDLMTRHWRVLKHYLREHVKETGEAFTKDKNNKRDEIRFRGYEQWVHTLLGKESVNVMSLRYTRRHNGGSGKSMGVLMFQKIPHGHRTKKWISYLNKPLFEEIKTGKVKNTDTHERLRDMLFWAANAELSSKEIGGLLNLSTRTVGAYKANAARK
jgi:hypothetical protein